MRKLDEGKEAPCQKCGMIGNVGTTIDRHHPRGRRGENLLYYIYVCRDHHIWIGANPKEAFELGLREK